MGDKEALSFRSRSEVDNFLQTPDFQTGSSPFWYDGWRRINPHVRSERDTPITNPTYSGEFQVELDKDKTKVGDIWLKITRSALTGTGGATFARYQDFEGYAMFREMEILHGEHKINTSTDEHLWLRHRGMDDRDQVAWGDHLVFGDLPAATRNTLGTAQQDLYVKWFNPLGDDPRLFMGVQSLGSKVVLRMRTRPLNEITETDGTTVPTSASLAMVLRTTNYHFSDQEKNSHNRRTKGSGVRYRIQEWTALKKIDIATGVEGTEVEFELRGLVGAMSELAFVIYDTADRDFNPANPTNERYVFQQITSFRAEIASTRIIPPQEHVWNLHQHKRKFYVGTVGDNLYRWSFSENIEDPIGVWGHQGASQSHPIKLFITFAAAPAITNTWELRVWGRRNNWIKHQNSKLMRLVH